MNKVEIELTLYTFGRLTFGMMTSFMAEGASLGVALVSPPGKYWYLPEVLLFHGSESMALATGASEVDDVGLRPWDVLEKRGERERARGRKAEGGGGLIKRIV